MTESVPIRPDTSDMAAVHNVLRSSLASAPTFVGSAAGDADRRALIANYYANVLSFLEVHHDGEEELLFPLLIERAPDSRAHVDRAIGEHHDVVAGLATAKDAISAWEANGDADASGLVGALRALDEVLSPHLDHEEATIVPLASDHLTAEEWGRLPGHGMANFTGDKVWLILGLVRENMTSEQRAMMLENMPPPARQMWETTGEASFDRLIVEVRQTR